MEGKEYTRRRAITILILDADQARIHLRLKGLLSCHSVLMVRLNEGKNMNHEETFIYDNRCTQQELAQIIENQVQRILDAHDRGAVVDQEAAHV